MFSGRFNRGREEPAARAVPLVLRELGEQPGTPALLAELAVGEEGVMCGAGAGSQDPVSGLLAGKRWQEAGGTLLRRAVGSVPVPRSAARPPARHILSCGRARRAVIRRDNGDFPGKSRLAKRYLKKSYA